MTQPWNEPIDFWKEAGPKKWFAKDNAFDAAIIERFAAMYEDAAMGKLDHWAEDPKGCLGLILVLDQFSRNMFRGDAKSFAADPKALEISQIAVDSDYGKKVDPELAAFLFMPFMHSEDIEDQKHSVTLQAVHGGEENVKAAKWHLEIIERFGRFPHRNEVLGRQTTPQEQAYLDDGGFKG